MSAKHDQPAGIPDPPPWSVLEQWAEEHEGEYEPNEGMQRSPRQDFFDLAVAEARQAGAEVAERRRARLFEAMRLAVEIANVRYHEELGEWFDAQGGGK